MIINHTEQWVKNIQTAGYNGAHTIFRPSSLINFRNKVPSFSFILQEGFYPIAFNITATRHGRLQYLFLWFFAMLENFKYICLQCLNFWLIPALWMIDLSNFAIHIVSLGLQVAKSTQFNAQFFHILPFVTGISNDWK